MDMGSMTPFVNSFENHTGIDKSGNYDTEKENE
jgi:hypothetical protein